MERFEAAGVPANVIAVGDVVYIMPRSADSDAYPTGAPASLEMIWEFDLQTPRYMTLRTGSFSIASCAERHWASGKSPPCWGSDRS